MSRTQHTNQSHKTGISCKSKWSKHSTQRWYYTYRNHVPRSQKACQWRSGLWPQLTRSWQMDTRPQIAIPWKVQWYNHCHSRTILKTTLETLEQTPNGILYTQKPTTATKVNTHDWWLMLLVNKKLATDTLSIIDIRSPDITVIKMKENTNENNLCHQSILQLLTLIKYK